MENKEQGRMENEEKKISQKSNITLVNDKAYTVL
jgi:hypothetical protein